MLRVTRQSSWSENNNKRAGGNNTVRALNTLRTKAPIIWNMEKVDTKPHVLTTRCFWPPVGLGVSAENSLRLHPPSTFWIQLDLETLKTRSS